LQKRWPQKRELLAYFTLYKYTVFKKKDALNLGEAIDVLRALVGSKRVAEDIVRTLARKGMLIRLRPALYRVVPLEELLRREAALYFASRLRRRGCNAKLEDKKLVVEEGSGSCGDDMLAEIARALGLDLEILGAGEP